MNQRELEIVRQYLSPYLPRIGLIIVLAFICTLFEAISLGALVPLLQIMEDQANPGGTLWGMLESLFGTVGMQLTFTSLLALLTCLFLIGQALLYVKKVLQIRLRLKFAAEIKNELYRRILASDMVFLYSQRAGNFNNVLTFEVESASYAIFAAAELLTDILFIGVYAVMLLYISVELTVITLGISLFTFYFLNSVIRKSQTFGLKMVQENTFQNEYLTERFSLLKLIKASSAENLEQGRFQQITASLQATYGTYWILGVLVEVLFQSMIFIIAVLVLFFSIEYFNIQLALLLVFLFILVRITAPLRDFNTRRHELARQIPSFMKIHQVMEEVTTGSRVRDGTREFTGFAREITFDRVSFSYLPGTPVVSDLSLTIPKNEMVALVGASGGGKSTVSDLLIRLLDPESGSIRVDGTDLREFTLRSWHARLGVVSQDIFLFNDSVLQNICYGSDQVSPDRAVEAARVANAHDFIMGLEHGYDTVLGEKGVKISGGQRQRIALARALYKNPEILLLDEATSSLDSESEKIIQNSIAGLRKRYTIVVIAHRLSTIEGADRIYVIEQGRIVESGSHQELLATGSTYPGYYQIQRGGNGNQVL
ncbi:MAG: ABC transporter ATP-binding protein/permease [Methanomicrobiales archaeon]|nr:ABC transporter ATP-binding protein/permease [Methanomicrobiales archaeon]